MTAFLFGITLMTGFIAGFVTAIVIAQLAMNQSTAEILTEAGFDLVDGKLVRRNDRLSPFTAAASLCHPETTTPMVYCS